MTFSEANCNTFEHANISEQLIFCSNIHLNDLVQLELIKVKKEDNIALGFAKKLSITEDIYSHRTQWHNDDDDEDDDLHYGVTSFHII